MLEKNKTRPKTTRLCLKYSTNKLMANRKKVINIDLHRDMSKYKFHQQKWPREEILLLKQVRITNRKLKHMMMQQRTNQNSKKQ